MIVGVFMEIIIFAAFLTSLLAGLQRKRKGKPDPKKDKMITFIIAGILILEIIVVAWAIFKYL